MSFLKKKLDNYLNDFFEQKTIEIMCWDSSANGTDIHFYINLQSYPPIGALINVNENSKLFKIESLEIQNSNGLFCVARGSFID